jgi:hypothetical protein
MAKGNNDSDSSNDENNNSKNNTKNTSSSSKSSSKKKTKAEDEDDESRKKKKSLKKDDNAEDEAKKLSSAKKKKNRKEDDKEDDDSEDENKPSGGGAAGAPGIWGSKLMSSSIKKRFGKESTDNGKGDGDKKKGEEKKKVVASDDESDDDNDENEGLLSGKTTKSKRKGGGKGGKKSSSSSKHALEIIAEGLASRFTPSQKDVKGKPLHISEAPGYVRIDFGDGTGPMGDIGGLMREVEDEVVSSGSRMTGYGGGKDSGDGKGTLHNVYVESASSGRFFKYATPSINGDGSSNNMNGLSAVNSGGILDDNSYDNSYEDSREAAMEGLERFLQTSFLTLQGLLAGYSGQTVYQAFASTTDANFLREYARMSNETRRFYFVFTTICTVGAMNNWRAVRENKEAWRRRPPSEKTELLFLVVCYFSALCFTLVSGITDIEYYYHSGVQAEELETGEFWYDVALKDKSFGERIDVWRWLCVGRFISCTVGWLVVCRVLHRESYRSAAASRLSDTLNDQLKDRTRRIQQLTGSRLDSMSKDELLELAQVQRVAVEQTELVLGALPPTAAEMFGTAGGGVTPSTGGGLAGGGGLRRSPSNKANTSFNPTITTGAGGMITTPSPFARARTQSTLPDSISAKAPAPIFTGGEENI